MTASPRDKIFKEKQLFPFLCYHYVKFHFNVIRFVAISHGALKIVQ